MSWLYKPTMNNVGHMNKYFGNHWKKVNQNYFRGTTRQFMKTLDHGNGITFNNEHKAHRCTEAVAWKCSVKKRVLKNFDEIHRKTPVLKSLF